MARILLQSFSYFSCCDQPACNQAWPDGGRSGRLTAVIFPGCQFTGTIIVASSWQSQLSLGYGCPPKSFFSFLPSQPWTVLPAVSLLILPLTRRPALVAGLPDLRPGANRAAWNPWFPDSHSCLRPHYLLTVWRISWISFPLLQCVAWLVLPQTLSLKHVSSFRVLMSAHLALSLTLDGLNLWAQTHTDELNHAGFPKSVHIKLVISHDWHRAVRQLPQPQGSWNFPNIVTISLVWRVQETAVGKATETWVLLAAQSLLMAKSDYRKREISEYWGMNEVGFLKINRVCLYVHDKSVSFCSSSKIAVVYSTSSEWAFSGRRITVIKAAVWFIWLKKVASDLNSFGRC